MAGAYRGPALILRDVSLAEVSPQMAMLKQRLQYLKINRVPIAAAFGVFLLWRFQYLGNVGESLVTHDRLESFKADLSAADVVVAVDPAAELFLGIVQVQHL